MQTDAQKLVVVRDQFALKGLSDDALKQILPAYKEAMERLQFLLRTMPPGNIERELWLRTQLATIEAQFRPVAERIYQVLPEAQARAFEEGLTNARKYLEAGGIQPEPAAATTTLSSTTIGGQQVSVTGNLPGLNITSAVDKGFISPSITRQQIVAAARETGFSVLSPGGSEVGVADLLPKWMAAESNQVVKHLRAGFLVGSSNEEIMREIGPLGPGRKGWAMTEAVVRTSMAEASQSAHDAFYEANEDLLPKTKSGYRWWWDASNDTRLCPVCAPLDGIKFKERDQPPHSWPAHFSCRCKILPWTATQELMEEEDGPAKGSFLEATPVEYDRRGKRKPPPPGYTGDNAYKRPMKIDGKQQWVRRRDLGAGETTAGDMLQNANEHSKRMVLGKHTEAFNKLTGKGGQYEKDPQGAVRKLLGNPLPPGSAPPRPTRGPGPKPVPPAPKAPATPRPKAAPTPAPKAEPKPPSGTQASVQGRQFMNGKGALSAQDVADGMAKLTEGDSESARNVQAMLDFQQKKNIATVWSNGREKGPIGPDFDHWKNPKLVSSIRDGIARGDGRAQGIMGNIADELEKDRISAFLGKVGKVSSGADGHSIEGGGFIALKQGSHQIRIDDKAVDRIRNAVRASVDAASSGKPKQVAYADLWDKTGKTTWKSKEGWAVTYVHEMGHQIHWAGGTTSITDYLPEALRKAAAGRGPEAIEAIARLKALGWTPSQYGGTNLQERFAETFVQWVFAPERLKSANPAAYNWIADTVARAMK